jgi:hypothetical protein
MVTPPLPHPKKRAPAKRKPAAKPRRAAAGDDDVPTRPATTARQQLAERAVLIPVGVALEARDHVAGTVGELVTTTRSRNALEKQPRRLRGPAARARESSSGRCAAREHGWSARHAPRRGFDCQRDQVGKNLTSTSKPLPPWKKWFKNSRRGHEAVNGLRTACPVV